MNAEYYPFGETWGNIVTNAKATSEEGNNPVFTHLISGVSADFSNMDGYKVSELEIDVTDVQKDFDKFAGYYEYKKDNTKNVGDDGQISPEFDYTKGPGAITPVHDMFKFTGNVNGKKADIAIDMLPSFTGQVAGMTMSDLIKVDVKISKCEPNYDALSALFEWDGNTSLVEAVKNTLQEHNPKGKIIYTYYIKANE